MSSFGLIRCSVRQNFDLNFFVQLQGLQGSRHCVWSLGDSEASLEDIVGVFGPRHDKNGWHYRLYSTIQM